MKKLTAIILSIIFALSLVACNSEKVKSENLAESSVSTIIFTAEDTKENTSQPDASFEDVSSLDEFVNQLEEDGYVSKNEENEDGSITVELVKPEPTIPETPRQPDTTTNPAIPTIDKNRKPKSEKEQTLDTTSQPELKPTPAPAPEKPQDPMPNITSDPEPDKPAENPIPSEPEKPKQPEYTFTTGQKHTALSVTERYLYTTLNDQQKQWYLAIDKAVRNLESKVSFNVKMSENNNYYIYHMYMFDNPDVFYLANTVSIYNRSDGTSELLFYYSDGVNCSRGELSDELRASILEKKTIFENKIEEIISTIPADAPDVWKEKLIYKYILEKSHYNLGAKWNGFCEPNWNAYGILVNGYGVCESYSEAFQTLCHRVGIQCTSVVGVAGGGHKWNAVQLDGEWYMCDITFDDPIGIEPGVACFYYFNRTSEWFIENCHDWSNCDYYVPQCNGTKYDYDAYFGTSRWGW